MFNPETTGIINHVIVIGFYLLVAIFTLASAIAVYSLVRYGKDKVLILGVSLTYIVLASALFIIALSQLHQINF